MENADKASLFIQLENNYILLAVTLLCMLSLHMGLSLSLNKTSNRGIHYSQNPSNIVRTRMRILSPKKERIEKPLIKKKAHKLPQNKIRHKAISQKKIENIEQRSQGQQTLLASYLSEIRKTIERHKRYPTLAKRLRHQGKVIVQFILKKDGSYESVKIVKHSLHKLLNREALESINRIKTFKSFPNEFKQAQFELKIPINFSLY